jgi:hypothetical protein
LRATQAADASTSQNLRRTGYDPNNIFPSSANVYNNWAICKDSISKYKFPKLNAPTSRGGCVRYFRYIDITGVVTELHFYRKDGIHTACDCIAKCLERPTSCTNWVYKNIFNKELDGGYRSCTLYSSPNLPSNVTLDYDLSKSTGYDLLQSVNNPQPGAPAPFTFSNAANTVTDAYGVSGFIVQDQDYKLHC